MPYLNQNRNRKIKTYLIILIRSLLLWAGCLYLSAEEKGSVRSLSFSDLKKEQPGILSQFEKSDFQNEAFEISEELKAFEGRKVGIEGYIISGGGREDENYEFLLAESPWDFCCQGVPPTPFTCLYVESDNPFIFERTSVVRAEGILRKKISRNTSGQIQVLFSLSQAIQTKTEFHFNPDYFPLILVFAYLFYVIIKKFFKRKPTLKALAPHSFNPKLLVRIDHLTVGYRKKEILTDIDLDLFKSDALGIIGPNGSGKTTFIRTLMGILSPLKGSLQRKEGLKFGYVMQRQFVESLYPFKVRDIVLMGRYGLIQAPRRPGRDDLKNMDGALELTGITSFKNIPFRELSGGQKQRVLIARAMCSEPDLLILDEPTNDMDLEGEESVINLVKFIQREKHTAIVIISHLLPVVLNLCSRFLFLEGNNRHEFLSLEDLIEKDALARLYRVPVRIVSDEGRYSIHIKGGNAHV